MRLTILATLLAGSVALAQRPPATTFGNPGAGTIYGNMVNSGRPPSPGPGGHGGAYRGSGGFGGPAASHPRHSNAVIVPYPVIWGSPYYGYGYDVPPAAYYGAPPAGYTGDPNYNGDPNYSQGYSPQSMPPVVIINQNYRPDTVNPVLRDYSNTPLPQPSLKMYEQPTHPFDGQPVTDTRPGGVATIADDNPTVYLLAMKDHTIFPAIAYWVEGDTLNYITTQGTHNRATMDLVDRDFSKQLNDERHVEFKLPGK